jgi:DNA-directed RNA polymerase I and III subunit RPAC1
LDNDLDLAQLQETMKFEIVSLKGNDMVVNISGIDAPMANALRRVMIADIPSIAFDKVVLYQNTSILHDEVMAHRLGLVPVFADPDEFIAKGPNDDFNEHNSIKFKLNVKCTRKPEYKGVPMTELLKLDPEQYLDNCVINTGDLVWEPLGN